MRNRWLGAAVGVVAIASVVVVLVLVENRGESMDSSFSDLPAAATKYDGPLYVAEGRYGAAGQALDCARPAAGSFERADVYSEGATSSSVEAALDTAHSEGLFLFAPTDDLTLAKEEDDRAMLTFESEGRILVALVFHDGPATEGAGGPGWYLESSARCDFALFPEEVAAKAGYQLWRDGDGVAVPVTRVYSAPGPEHCDWQSMVFLYLDDRAAYVRDPEPDLREFAGPYRAEAELPPDAVRTGYQRGGRSLWLSTDRDYAYVGTPSSVEAWPRFHGGCA